MALAGSEMEFDIASSLLPKSRHGNDFDGTIEGSKSSKGNKEHGKWNERMDRSHGNESSHGVEEEEEEREEDGTDEESFMAAQRAASLKASSLGEKKSGKKSGGFQSFGLNATLLKNITRKGFSVPTPIQRKSIPAILDGQDVVGMARTGSGKTAAFVIPMIEKLKMHSAKVGTRAILLAPSRELALQTLKSIKELSRGTDLRTALLVGGDSMEDQFAQMVSNPDITVATPGRFLHLMIEMSLELSSVRYVVFDEADRLFEMGFATQLTEILYALPQTRQTHLFSATLPKSLVEFANAGLKEPNLIRLDIETKISPDLQSTFLMVKSADKEGSLLHVLTDVIKVPVGHPGEREGQSNSKKRKRTPPKGNSIDSPTETSTAIFVATKHHVEYITNLLGHAGYAVAYNYGSLDQAARRMQIEKFRTGSSSILVVTDVAARGIDIPLLANVINYDFPPQPKVFIHRVGRTARAGREGWSFSLVQAADLPYLLDLQMFLGRNLVHGRGSIKSSSFAQGIVVGRIPSSKLEPHGEWVEKLLVDQDDLSAQRTVASKGEKLYQRTRNAASAESVKRAKTEEEQRSLQTINAIYDDNPDDVVDQREIMLRRISGFRPAETIFEIGRRGDNTKTGEILRKQREILRHQKTQQISANAANDQGSDQFPPIRADRIHEALITEEPEPESYDHEDFDGTIPATNPEDFGHKVQTWRDEENFISYRPRDTNAVEENGYGVQSGSRTTNKSSNFVEDACGATMDLTKDESQGFSEATRPSQVRWDKRSKKFVSRINDEDGSKSAKLVTSESGQKIAASFRSGRFDAWQKSNRLKKQKVGEQEDSRQSRPSKVIGRFKHFAERAAKKPDKFRDDYHRQRKKLAELSSKQPDTLARRSNTSTLRSADDIRKARELKERRKKKNARPPRRRRV